MICILKMTDGEITGWIIAVDLDDATRQAHGAGERELANLFYSGWVLPPAGKYVLPTGHIALVS
jgi:hypothetical protein